MNKKIKQIVKSKISLGIAVFLILAAFGLVYCKFFGDCRSTIVGLTVDNFEECVLKGFHVDLDTDIPICYVTKKKFFEAPAEEFVVTRPRPRKAVESDEEFDPLADLLYVDLPDQLLLDVPFTSQAPYGIWDPIHDEACEEASMIMVDRFYEKLSLNRVSADEEILSLVSWQDDNGYEYDIGSEEVQEVVSSYYGRNAKVYSGTDISVENIKKLLVAGYPVIVPAQGQMLGNPNFTGEGPPYHMLVIKGYDEDSFITNDPGTRNGESFEYSYEVLMDAIHDWTGSKDTVVNGQKAMVIVNN